MGAHGPGAPRVKEPAGHPDIGEGPEPLEVLPEEIGPNGLQVEFQEFRETNGLLLREVLGTLEERSSAVFEEVVPAVLLEGRSFLAPDLVDGLAELLHDMEPVKNVQCLRGLLLDHIQVRPPHVAVHESKFGRAFLFRTFERIGAESRPFARVRTSEGVDSRHPANRPW